MRPTTQGPLRERRTGLSSSVRWLGSKRIPRVSGIRSPAHMAPALFHPAFLEAFPGFPALAAALAAAAGPPPVAARILRAAMGEETVEGAMAVPRAVSKASSQYTGCVCLRAEVLRGLVVAEGAGFQSSPTSAL